jgi:hypothetical protein
MPVVLDLLQKVNNRTGVLLRLISPQLRKKAGIISISTAVIMTVLYSVFQKLNRPPKELRHLPYVGYFSFLKNVFKDELYETYSNQLIMPLLKKESNGVYAVWQAP